MKYKNRGLIIMVSPHESKARHFWMDIGDITEEDKSDIRKLFDVFLRNGVLREADLESGKLRVLVSRKQLRKIFPQETKQGLGEKIDRLFINEGRGKAK